MILFQYSHFKTAFCITNSPFFATVGSFCVDKNILNKMIAALWPTAEYVTPLDRNTMPLWAVEELIPRQLHLCLPTITHRWYRRMDRLMPLYCRCFRHFEPEISLFLLLIKSDRLHSSYLTLRFLDDHCYKDSYGIKWFRNCINSVQRFLVDLSNRQLLIPSLKLYFFLFLQHRLWNY